jgi:hypothetical protein
MATITLEYNARNRTAEKVLSVITAMNDVFRVKTAEKKKDDSLMTKEEYFAMLDESIRQAERGEVYSMKEGQTVKQFLAELCTN